MFGEISIWSWMGAAIVFAIGGATGFFISRQLKDKRTRELEEKLVATRSELADYRSEVNQHFLKTSLLVSKLTNDYREVYEHLATGAQKLCKEKPGTPKLDLPDTKILPAAEAGEEERTAIESVSETAVEAIPETGVETHEMVEQDLAADEISTPVAEETPSEESVQAASDQEKEKPAPEDVKAQDEDEEEVPLGAESAPSVDTELHKTHPSIH